jgi:hypothetical protein
MSLRREVFTTVGGFLTDVGRVGSWPLGCEETELCIRVRRLIPGSVIVYEPRARVRHRVTQERLRWRYFGARCYSEGLSKAVVARHAGWQAGLASERTYAARTLPRGVARGFADAALRGEAAGLVRAGAIVAGLSITTFGYAAGRLRRFTPEPSLGPPPSPELNRATGVANA